MRRNGNGSCITVAIFPNGEPLMVTLREHCKVSGRSIHPNAVKLMLPIPKLPRLPILQVAARKDGQHEVLVCIYNNDYRLQDREKGYPQAQQKKIQRNEASAAVIVPVKRPRNEPARTLSAHLEYDAAYCNYMLIGTSISPPAQNAKHEVQRPQ